MKAKVQRKTSRSAVGSVGSLRSPGDAVESPAQQEQPASAGKDLQQVPVHFALSDLHGSWSWTSPGLFELCLSLVACRVGFLLLQMTLMPS